MDDGLTPRDADAGFAAALGMAPVHLAVGSQVAAVDAAAPTRATA